MATKWSRGSLVEQDSHSRDFQGPGCVFQNAPSLLRCDAWKPLQKVLHGGAVFYVFEQRGDRYTSTAKHPCTADAISGTLDIGT
jgi:hypothetical protein